MSISLLSIIVIAVLIYLIFFVLPVPVQLRNVLAIILVRPTRSSIAQVSELC